MGNFCKKFLFNRCYVWVSEAKAQRPKNMKYFAYPRRWARKYLRGFRGSARIFCFFFSKKEEFGGLFIQKEVQEVVVLSYRQKLLSFHLLKARNKHQLRQLQELGLLKSISMHSSLFLILSF